MKTMGKTSIIVSLLVALSAGIIDAQCEFPAELQGNWQSSLWEQTDINKTHFPPTYMKSYGVLNFTCHMKQGDLYVGESKDLAFIPGVSLTSDVYVCFELKAVSTDKYLVYIRTARNQVTQDERLVLKPTGDLAIDHVCNEYVETGHHYIMIRTGSAAAAAIDCPAEFQGNFTYEFQTEGQESCGHGNASFMDVCANITQINFNYNICSTPQAYSAGGLLSCVHTVKVGQVNFLTVYNLDDQVTNNATYRYTCYVWQKVGDEIFATQHPSSCVPSQNSTFVPSDPVVAPGATLHLKQTGSCEREESTTVTVTTTPSTTISTTIKFTSSSPVRRAEFTTLMGILTTALASI